MVAKLLDETVVLRFGVEHGQALAANRAGQFDPHLVAQLRGPMAAGTPSAGVGSRLVMVGPIK
jgi:hypothetical protein